MKKISTTKLLNKIILWSFYDHSMIIRRKTSLNGPKLVSFSACRHKQKLSGGGGNVTGPGSWSHAVMSGGLETPTNDPLGKFKLVILMYLKLKDNSVILNDVWICLDKIVFLLCFFCWSWFIVMMCNRAARMSSQKGLAVNSDGMAPLHCAARDGHEVIAATWKNISKIFYNMSKKMCWY